jgi:hypothetical protein
MAYAEFYNLNSKISYPFVPTSTDTFQCTDGSLLPKSLVVDCGFTVGLPLSYDPEVGAVYLHSVQRTGDTLVFVFRVRPNDGTEREFTFVRDKDAEFGLTDYVEATGGASYGIGFLATGSIRSYYDQLSSGEVKQLMSYSGTLVSYEATAEPATVVSLKNHYVSSISVGNMLRLADTPCAGCGVAPVVDNTTVKLQTDAAGMAGRIRFRSGYNLSVTVNQRDNVVSLTAAVGQGLGEACNNDPLRYVGDIPDTGARCRDYIYTINGITPNVAGAFQLTGGGAFFVTPMGAGYVVVNSRIGQITVCE